MVKKKAAPRKNKKSPNSGAARLLDWYDRHRRRLPWRYDPGTTADPYAVWLSEIMLQQTTVAAVKGYFERFMAKWPTIGDLAAAPLDDVLTAWAGLGYYARARNLHRCAKTVTETHGGRFPEAEAELLELPGVGPYTAAAISAIAFGHRAVVVDGNVERVMARLHDVHDPLPRVKDRLRSLADELTPVERPGDYAQAVMDLGATICTPKSPACALCPWMADCRARKAGTAADLPKRAAKKQVPIRYGTAFWITRSDGAVLLRRRAEKGLLGGMMEFPSTDWGDAPKDPAAAQASSPAKVSSWTRVPGLVAHTFTHFHLELAVVAASVTAAEARRLSKAGLTWAAFDRLDRHALPSVMQKIARHVARNEL